MNCCISVESNGNRGYLRFEKNDLECSYSLHLTPKIDVVAHLMYMFVVHKFLILCLLLSQIFVLNTRN
jgi:hypothetical protein